MLTSALVLGLVATLTGLWGTLSNFADVVLYIILLVLLVWLLRIVAKFVSDRWN